MKAETILQTINECQSLLSFVFEGKEGNIDPYYDSNSGPYWLLCFDGAEYTAKSEDEVLTTPFIKGKSLEEVAHQLTDIDW